jgi:hypothetical protein
MSSKLQKYYDRVGEVASDAALFSKLFVNPILDSEGSRVTFKSPQERKAAVAEAIKGSFLENLGSDALAIAATAANSVAAYGAVYDSIPPEEVRASAIGTMRNMIAATEGSRTRMVMDSATDNMSSQDGITKRNHQIALITPVALVQATNDFVTYVPPDHDRAELFVINRKAGSTFGEMRQGDLIDETFRKQYATMDQSYVIGVGDGTKKNFPFAMVDLSINETAMPIRKGYVRVYHDGDLVAEDYREDGLLTGAFEVGNTMVTVTSNGTVNYNTGAGEVVFSVAPAAGLEISIGVDIDIEKAPQLIPLIDHQMQSFMVRPHEGAITVAESIQAVFAAKREFGMDLRGMQLTAARNALAAEKDRKRLQMMWKAARFYSEFPRYTPTTGVSYLEYRQIAIQEFLNGISMTMLQSNKKSGGVGIFCGLDLINYLRATTGFVERPNYVAIPQPHYVGRFGGYAIYCDPGAPTWEGLMIGKGQNYGDSGFIAADAISAIQYQHPINAPQFGAGKGMNHSDTLYELAYRDIHPYRGRQYFSRFKFIATEGGV